LILIVSTIALWWKKYISRTISVSVLIILILIILGFIHLIANFTILNPRSCVLYRDKTIIEQPVRLPGLTQRLLREATHFLEEHHDEPFFLFFSDVKVHTALFTGDEFRNRSGKGDFVDNVEELDWSVGEMMRTLRELELEDNTLVVFLSDNGPFLEEGHEAGTAGAIRDAQGEWARLKGGKGTNWEGGIRVPAIVYWKGRLVPRVTNQLVNSMDLFPTMIHLAGLEVPNDRIIDGRDLSSFLFDQSPPILPPDTMPTVLETLEPSKEIANCSAIHEWMFHWCGKAVTSVRHGHYKAHFAGELFDVGLNATGHRCQECCPDRVICRCDSSTFDPPLLYNLYYDPGERHPIDPKSEEYKREIALMDAARIAHQNSLYLEDNWSSQLEALPRPWLEPCCNPPSCRCCVECTAEEDQQHVEFWS